MISREPFSLISAEFFPLLRLLSGLRGQHVYYGFRTGLSIVTNSKERFSLVARFPEFKNEIISL